MPTCILAYVHGYTRFQLDAEAITHSFAQLYPHPGNDFITQSTIIPTYIHATADARDYISKKPYTLTLTTT